MASGWGTLQGLAHGPGTFRRDNLIGTEGPMALELTVLIAGASLVEAKQPWELQRWGGDWGLREPRQWKKAAGCSPSLSWSSSPYNEPHMCQWSLPMWEGDTAQGDRTIGAGGEMCRLALALLPFPLSSSPLLHPPSPSTPQNQEQSLWATALST